MLNETKECPECNGTGSIDSLSNYGQQYTDQKCRVCDGYGEVDEDYDPAN